MADVLNDLGQRLETHAEKFIELYQHLPAIILLMLIPIGLAYLLFGLRIYKLALGVLGFMFGALSAYHITRNPLVSCAIGVGTGFFAVLLQFLFMLIVAGLTFGAMAFVCMIAYFQAPVPLVTGTAVGVLGIVAAIKLLRFIIIVTTSAIGAAMVVPTLLVLIEHGGIAGTVDMTRISLDDFQATIGFAGLTLAGMIIQGVSWGREKREE